MNWLAHVFLSEPDIEFRLGNLLADLVKRQDRAAMSAGFLRGALRHQAIDAFTDSHPIVHRSRARIRGDYRHTRGILIDVFYDHFLSLAWNQYSGIPLHTFTAGVYADLGESQITLPKPAREAVHWMLLEDRLGSYRTIHGIESALYRISQRLTARLGKPFALEKAVSELGENFAGLEQDFAEFFPLLRSHIEQVSEADRRQSVGHDVTIPSRRSSAGDAIDATVPGGK
jgi:acyl carrier protein phosphodiesterase